MTRTAADPRADDGQAPLWRLPRDLFRFTSTDRAELHMAVMQVFGDANECLVTALTFDDVRDGLEGVGWPGPPQDDELGHSLRMLLEWRLLDVSQDHARQYATAEEYERKNLLYALTRRGEAAFDGVQHALVQLSATGALQAAVLDAIADRLAALHRLLRDDDGDDRRVYITLAELETHLDGLRSNTKQFNNELQRLLRDEAADPAVLQDVKAATVAYLEEYLSNLEGRSRTIAEAVGRVEEIGVAVLHHRALAGADLPSLAAHDPAPRWLAQRAARWEGLQHWFRPPDGGRPRIEDLRGVAQRAIVSLLRILERLRESRRRATSTAADLRTLARWFAACPCEDDAHRLWNAAFGLWPSRHAHLAADDPEATPTATPWSGAPPVPVSSVLRTRGRLDHVVRSGGVRDTAALRRRRQAEAVRERGEVEAAWRALTTDGRVRLSTFGRLEHATFARLLELFGMALARAPDSGGRRRATTSDGQLEVVLHPDGGGRVVLHTPLGRFDAPDYAVEIRSTLAAAGPTERREQPLEGDRVSL